MVFTPSLFLAIFIFSNLACFERFNVGRPGYACPFVHDVVASFPYFVIGKIRI